MKPARNIKYLAFIRKRPCVICFRSWGVEAAHTGDHGLRQKSSDLLAIPLCRDHHKLRFDSYHVLGRVRFEEAHEVSIQELTSELQQLASKSGVDIEARDLPKRKPPRREGFMWEVRKHG